MSTQVAPPPAHVLADVSDTQQDQLVTETAHGTVLRDTAVARPDRSVLPVSVTAVGPPAAFIAQNDF